MQMFLLLIIPGLAVTKRLVWRYQYSWYLDILSPKPIKIFELYQVFMCQTILIIPNIYYSQKETAHYGLGLLGHFAQGNS